ncbi:MAG: ABC transporter ATP-binding protein [Propionibacteriaceae bacterium]|nr:ABC transporter ATP-binding protein [Propionibacteriaceae bacterium]
MIKDCVKTYGKLRALDNVSFDVHFGQMVGLVGPNGAGKTTLFHAMMGLMRLNSGSITLDGESVSSVNAKSRIAFMPDDLPRPMQLSGREMIEFTARLYGRRADGLEGLAERLQLSGRLDQRLESYSHGMRRKIDLMAALLLCPDILVLDEPFSGLDPETVVLVQQVLTEMKEEGVGILLSSHDLELVETLVDDVVMIHCGRVVFRGATETLVASVQSQDIRSAFLTLVGDNYGKRDGDHK